MELANKLTTPAISLVLTFVFGFWLSHLGKPYNGILFNIHKLVALGAVVLTAIQLSKMLKTADALASIILLLVVAAFCVVALFASGALMSMGKMDAALMLNIHRITSPVLVVAVALAAYLLKGKI